MLTHPDHDDWFAIHWSDLQYIFQYFKIMPPRTTVGEMRSVADDFVALRRSTSDAYDMYALEQVLDKSDVPGLSLWTVFKLLEACDLVPDEYDPATRSALEYIPLAELGRIIGRHVGRLELDDVVGLTEMAHEQANEMNVLAGLPPDTVHSHLSGRALRTLTPRELRFTLERLSEIIRNCSERC